MTRPSPSISFLLATFMCSALTACGRAPEPPTAATAPPTTIDVTRPAPPPTLLPPPPDASPTPAPDATPTPTPDAAPNPEPDASPTPAPDAAPADPDARAGFVAPTVTDGYCVIAGSPPYARFAAARKRADELAALGYPSAAVYDTRRIPELAYGLLVIVVDVRASEDDAKALVKELSEKDKAAKANVRACTLGIAEPIWSAQAIASTELGREPLDVEALELGLISGCAGYSPAHRAALCVKGTLIWNMVDVDLAVVPFPGAPSAGAPASIQLTTGNDDPETIPEPSEELARQIASLVRDGGFVALPEGRPLGVGKTATWVDPKLTLRLARERAEPGSKTFRVLLGCPGDKRDPAEIGTLTYEGDEDPQAFAWVIPGTDLVLVQVAYSVAGEGMYGDGLEVYTTSLAEACKAPEAPPTPDAPPTP